MHFSYQNQSERNSQKAKDKKKKVACAKLLRFYIFKFQYNFLIWEFYLVKCALKLIKRKLTEAFSFKRGFNQNF